MADKKAMEIEAIDLSDLSLEELEKIKEYFREAYPEVREIVFSRHLLTKRPKLTEDMTREAELCSRCRGEMSGENEERVVAGDICKDSKFYCIECVMEDQCGCLEIGS